MDRTIRVTGRGRLSVKPDMIRLNLTLEGLRPDYSYALNASGEETEDLRDIFENLGFDRKDLRTVSFDIRAEYSSYKDRQGNYTEQFEGYTYRHRMKIEFPLDNAVFGRVLNALVSASVCPEMNIEYTVSDPEKYKNELLADAVADSKAKAAVLAGAAGVELGDIALIDYSWGRLEFVSRPYGSGYERMLSSEEAADADICVPDIEADNINVSDNVTVVWEIKQ